MSAQVHCENWRVDAELEPRFFRKALEIRLAEQRLLELFAAGKLFGTVHTCVGQEFSAIAIAECLREGDFVYSNHRCHGHFLAQTGDVEGLIAEIMGKESGVCGGRGGSQHLCSKGFFSNGIQGGIVPVAAGLAMAQKLGNPGGIAVVFIGDGTLGEGVLYETMNLASKWSLPLLIVLENNAYAQSTSKKETLAGDICARAEAFGIESSHSSTREPAFLMTVASNCVERVRRESRPHFLRIDTSRLMAHSKGDDTRDKREVEGIWERDPLTVFLRDNVESAEALQAEIREEIECAVIKADGAPSAELRDDDEERAPSDPCGWEAANVSSGERIVTLLHDSLRRNLARDKRIQLIGEDIEGPYGGAFKVTKGLSQEFPGRVRNTPISEAAIVGIGNGLALAGKIPVVEIMFGDFIALAADQIINHAAKFRFMYNNQVDVPLVIRTPMGGKRGYGPTHSQSLEKHLLGLPGTTVLALNSRLDPGVIYDRLFSTIDRPTIIVENKTLYGARLSEPVSEGFVLEHSDERFPTTRLRPMGEATVTIVTYGGMLPEIEQAVEQLFLDYDIICEVVCPCQIYPLNLWPVLESVSKTGRMLLVEEGLSFAAFGSEVVAQVCERSAKPLQRIKRVASKNHPIPASRPMEKATLPTVESIVAAARALVDQK